MNLRSNRIPLLKLLQHPFLIFDHLEIEAKFYEAFFF
jgi:hypothetical protein